MSQAAIRCPCGLELTFTGWGRSAQVTAWLIYEGHECPARKEEHEVESTIKMGFQPNPVEEEEYDDDDSEDGA